jgi:predicted small secreted protein
VSTEVAVILLLALAGFLLGGVYSTWKTARVTAVVLLVAAVLAAGGAIAWLAS